MLKITIYLYLYIYLFIYHFRLLFQSLPYRPFQYSSNSWHLFSLIISLCIYIICSVHIKLLVSMFSGLIIWHWATNCCVLTTKEHLSLSHISSAAHSCIVQASCLLWHIEWCHPCLTHSYVITLVRLYVHSSWC